MLYLVFGICRIAPLYYLVSIFCGICTDRVSRSVPVEAAQAIIPATSLGFILPTILFFMRFEEGNMQQQDFVALWLSYPVYCSLLVAVIAAAIRLFNKPKVTSATDATNLPVDNGAEQDEDRDVRPLRQAYAFAIAVMAIAHISLLLFIFFRSDLTFADVFADLPEILSDWTTFEESIVAFFLLKYDMLIYVLAQFIYSVYVVVELRSKCRAIIIRIRVPVKPAVLQRTWKMNKNTNCACFSARLYQYRYSHKCSTDGHR